VIPHQNPNPSSPDRRKEKKNKIKRKIKRNLGSNFASLIVIYFGPYNLLGTFQRIMNSILQKLLHEEVLTNYMDDFVIPAKIMEELEE